MAERWVRVTPPGVNTAADIDLNDEFALACFTELLAQDDIVLANADKISVKEADGLGLVPISVDG